MMIIDCVPILVAPHTHFVLPWLELLPALRPSPLIFQVPPDWAQRMHINRWPELLPALPPDWPRHVQRSLALPDNAEAMLATLPPTWMAIMAEVG